MINIVSNKEARYFLKKIVLFYFLASIFFGCASSKDINKNNGFMSSTISMPNNKSTLGMVGKNIETNNGRVATGAIVKKKILITSAGEGAALLFVSNNSAEAAIINVVVSQTGEITVHNLVKYQDQPSKTILTGTSWVYDNADTREMIKFTSGVKGVYTVSKSTKTIHSLNFSYRVSDNDISLVFNINGMMFTKGTIAGNTMTLLSMDDDKDQINLAFNKINAP